MTRNPADFSEHKTSYYSNDPGFDIYSAQFVDGMSKLSTSLKQTLSRIAPITKNPVLNQEEFQIRKRKCKQEAEKLQMGIKTLQPLIDAQQQRMQQAALKIDAKWWKKEFTRLKTIVPFLKVIYELVNNTDKPFEENNFIELATRGQGYYLRDALNKFNCSELISRRREQSEELMRSISNMLLGLNEEYKGHPFSHLLNWYKYMLKNYDLRKQAAVLEEQMNVSRIEVMKIEVDEKENNIRSTIRNMSSINEAKSKIQQITEKISKIQQRVRQASQYRKP